MARHKRGDRPILVYDGECDFCRLWIARWRARTGDRIAYAPYQEVASQYPERPIERFRAAVQFKDGEGQWHEGAEAVYRSLGGAGLWLYRWVPGFAPASRIAYRWIAAHRPFCTRVTRFLWGSNLAPAGESRVSWLFLRLLGFVYLAAFLSLLPQVTGLFGKEGILPAANFLTGARAQAGASAFWGVPSVLWLGASDGALVAVCAFGCAFAALLVSGFVPGLAALGAWASYLSITAVGTTFLWFQWDSLLLEAGFLALLLAPWRLRSRPGTDAPRPAALALLRWLLFRLILASAAVKLSSGDPLWRNLTALQFHYQTQPIPPPAAWYFHHLPEWFQRLSVLVMFTVEGLAPFLLLGPRRVRLASVIAIVGLQILILVTGNYGFFNWLTLALCVCWLDDRVLTKSAAVAAPPRVRSGWLVRAVAVIVVLLTLPPFLRSFAPGMSWPRPVIAAEQIVSPLRIANGYGLFAIMTRSRPEITVEGSRDGVEWKAYEFRYKPGDVHRAPPFLGPHMPRLDWQMWFAALDGVQRSAWFLYLCERLLQGSHAVTGLLARNPFADQPPRYLRAHLSEYRFTTYAERRASGAWWEVSDLGLYCPTLTLVGGRLALAPPDSL